MSKTEEKILKLFLYNHNLRFNEIEKQLGVRSNKLAYHLRNLVEKEVLNKKGSTYKLSKKSENLIPYISEKNATLPAILIHLGNKKECFLYKRNKRPFKNKLSLPGGRLKVGESIEDGTKRIIKNKFNIEADLKKINSISLEHVKKEKKTLHSFLLIFVSVSSKNKIELVNIEKNKKKIISSDYKLLKKDLDKNIDIKTLNSRL